MNERASAGNGIKVQRARVGNGGKVAVEPGTGISSELESKGWKWDQGRVGNRNSIISEGVRVGNGIRAETARLTARFYLKIV